MRRVSKHTLESDIVGWRYYQNDSRDGAQGINLGQFESCQSLVVTKEESLAQLLKVKDLLPSKLLRSSEVGIRLP